MNKEFVPYDIALAMKELGFDEDCLGVYYPDLSDNVEPIPSNTFKNEAFIKKNWKKAPLYQQAFRWFREKYNIDARFHTYTHHKEGVRTDWMWDYIDGKKTSFDGHEKSDKEAQDACLRKLIEIVEENL